MQQRWQSITGNRTEMGNEQRRDLSMETEAGLDRIDWCQVMNEFGLSRQEIMGSPAVCRQLASGLFTDLVQVDTVSFSGLFSLHAESMATNGLLQVRAYAIEKPKSAADELYVLGNRIESEAVKRSLLEKTDWTGSDGRRRYGYANANAGCPVRLAVDGRRGVYLISVHQQTNRVVAQTIESVRDYFFKKDGTLRGRAIHGVVFTESQATSLCEGRVLRLEGCTDADGGTFGCFVQYDASVQQVVVCHPVWVKEALKAGMDL